MIDPDHLRVRNTEPDDFPAIHSISDRVYVHEPPWTQPYLANHRRLFPEGQFVCEHTPTRTVVGFAAALVVTWDDYNCFDSYEDMTDEGRFNNHDADGGTLYGAEIMTHPDWRRRGIGRRLYAARRQLVRELGLTRIRAGARLPGYARFAGSMSAPEYVSRVERGALCDPTLSFQLSEGFEVLAVVEDYIHDDAPSRGYAALIEWRDRPAWRRRENRGRGRSHSRPFRVEARVECDPGPVAVRAR